MKINYSLYNDSGNFFHRRKRQKCASECVKSFIDFLYQNAVSVEQLPGSLIWLFFLSYSILVVVGTFDMGDI